MNREERKHRTKNDGEKETTTTRERRKDRARRDLRRQKARNGGASKGKKRETRRGWEERKVGQGKRSVLADGKDSDSSVLRDAMVDACASPRERSAPSVSIVDSDHDGERKKARTTHLHSPAPATHQPTPLAPSSSVQDIATQQSPSQRRSPARGCSHSERFCGSSGLRVRERRRGTRLRRMREYRFACRLGSGGRLRRVGGESFKGRKDGEEGKDEPAKLSKHDPIHGHRIASRMTKSSSSHPASISRSFQTGRKGGEKGKTTNLSHLLSLLLADRRCASSRTRSRDLCVSDQEEGAGLSVWKPENAQIRRKRRTQTSRISHKPPLPQYVRTTLSADNNVERFSSSPSVALWVDVDVRQGKKGGGQH
jgi:hypothetical protein